MTDWVIVICLVTMIFCLPCNITMNRLCFVLFFFANSHAETVVRFQDMILSSAVLPVFWHHIFQDGLNNSWIFATVDRQKLRKWPFINFYKCKSFRQENLGWVDEFLLRISSNDHQKHLWVRIWRNLQIVWLIILHRTSILRSGSILRVQVLVQKFRGRTAGEVIH